MPKEVDYSINQKQIMFRVIEFVEREKTGAVIPLHNTTGRVLAMLAISESSLFRVKKEIVDQRQKELDEPVTQEPISSRRRTISSTHQSHSHRKRRWSAVSYDSASTITTPLPSKKEGNSGQTAVCLSELAEDTIRYHFHLLLVSSRQTPTYYQQLSSLILGRESISHSHEGSQSYSRRA